MIQIPKVPKYLSLNFAAMGAGEVFKLPTVDQVVFVRSVLANYVLLGWRPVKLKGNPRFPGFVLYRMDPPLRTTGAARVSRGG